MTERLVAVFQMMEIFTSGDMYGGKTGQRHRDRQVHDRVKGGHLVDDGDIHIDGRKWLCTVRIDYEVKKRTYPV
jgi:hypothetical protein